jgi:antitoxin YobK
VDYSEIISLVDGAEYVDFAPFGEGVSDEWIDKAEQRLGFYLPESYKWWLKNFAGGEISGEEIYSIYEMDFDTVNGGDIVYMSIINERNFLCGKDKLFVCEPPGTGESFYFAIEENMVLVSAKFIGLT